MSVHPDEWKRIGRLGGNPTWTMKRTDGEPLQFVSWYDLDEPARTRLHQWGEEKGWVEYQDVYRVDFNDEEAGEETWFEVATEEEALIESGDDPDAVTKIGSWRATPSFPDAKRIGYVDPTDVLLAAYIRTECPDLDGVWWDDNYNPDNYSCPRGVIVRDPDSYSRREVG